MATGEQAVGKAPAAPVKGQVGSVTKPMTTSC